MEEMEKEIREQFHKLSKAAQSLDFDQYLEFFDTETFTSVNSDGTIFRSFEEFSEIYRPQFQAIRSYHSLEFPKVHINLLSENSAILVNQFIADIELHSGDRFQTTGAGAQVWKKKNDNWVLVHVSSSSPS